MVAFRVIRFPESRKLAAQGWVVERSALGETASIVSRVYEDKSDARTEAERLRVEEGTNLSTVTLRGTLTGNGLTTKCVVTAMRRTFGSDTQYDEIEIISTREPLPPGVYALVAGPTIRVNVTNVSGRWLSADC